MFARIVEIGSKSDRFLPSSFRGIDDEQASWFINKVIGGGWREGEGRKASTVQGRSRLRAGLSEPAMSLLTDL